MTPDPDPTTAEPGRHHFRWHERKNVGWCADCHRTPDDPVHSTQVEVDRGIDADDPRAAVEVPAVCRCGHPADTHPNGGICTACEDRRHAAGMCMGWWPPGSKTAQVELIEQQEEGDAHDDALDLPGQQRRSRTRSSAGADVTGPATATDPTGAVAGPPPDLDSHAIGGLTQAEADRFTEAIAPGPPDLRQAIQAGKTALRAWSPTSAVDRPGQAVEVILEAAWPYALQAATDKLRQLLVDKQSGGESDD